MAGWGLAILGAVLVALVAFAVTAALLFWRRRAESAAPGSDHVGGPEGTRRDLRAVPSPAGVTGGRPVTGVLPRDLAAPGGGLVLLQLSSQFCADCRAARAVLTDVAAEVPGTTVRVLDVAVRPELVRLLGIRRTPTVLVVDPAGVELARRVGVPRRADLLAVLDPVRRTG